MQTETLENEEFVPPPPPQEIPVAEPIFTPNNPPWNVWAAISVWFASVAFIVILPNLFLLPYIAAQELPIADEATLRQFVDTDPTAIVLRISAIIPAHILTLILAWIFITRLNKLSFRQTLGWSSGGMQWWHYFIILGGFYVAAAIIASVFPEQDNEMMRLLQSSRTAVYIIAFLATFSAPLVEEVVYRGLLFSALQRKAGGILAIVIVTFLFAGVHYFQYWGSPGTLIAITLLSLGLTLIRYKTKNLWPCIVLHTLINGLQSLFLLLQPYLPKEEEVTGLVHFLK